MDNPKMAGSGIIDCIPQTGKCPHDCRECFYNKGFYRTLDEPLIPTVEEAEGRVVRMNSGHDSALSKGVVLEVAKRYKDVFFNTATHDWDFPGPVVVTVNPDYYVKKHNDFMHGEFCARSKNLMMVRARVDLWEMGMIREICSCYSWQVPVVLTWMRYSTDRFLPRVSLYTREKHVTNSYWTLSKEVIDDITKGLQAEFPNVYLCGNRWSSLCDQCGNCLREYYATKERMREV